MAMPDSTARFSDRVADYVRYRPHYPDAVVRTLHEEVGLPAGAAVADLGSGTGISAELFLRHGCAVWAVEPNREMREAAEGWLGEQPAFHSVAGTAEATTLPDRSIDLAVAAQAFHWFYPARTRAELARILRSPTSPVALVWNSRQADTTPFLREYERLLLEFGTDYRSVNHRNIDPVRILAFFGGRFELRRFPNEQSFDFEGLRGRLLSSSYTPPEGHPDHAPMMARLAEIFAEHAEGGRVRFLYDTELYFGALAG